MTEERGGESGEEGIETRREREEEKERRNFLPAAKQQATPNISIAFLKCRLMNQGTKEDPSVRRPAGEKEKEESVRRGRRKQECV